MDECTRAKIGDWFHLVNDLHSRGIEMDYKCNDVMTVSMYLLLSTQ